MKRYLAMAALAVLSPLAHANDSHAQSGVQTFLNSILAPAKKADKPIDPSTPKPLVDLRDGALANKFFVDQAHLILNTAGGNQAAYEQMILMGQNGYSDALVFLGYLSDNGLGGVPVNSKFAAQYFREAAARGNMLGFHNLALLFMLGRGVHRDKGVALQLFARPAKAGIIESSIAVAMEHERTRLFTAAATIYGSVADNKNHPFATSRYGHYLLRGLGVNQSLPNAFTMLKKAAELWEVDAQWSLIELYRNGIGVQENQIEAMMWTYILQDNKYAVKYHPRIQQHTVDLSAADIAIARRSADMWIAAHPKERPPIDYSKSIWLEDLRNQKI